MKLIQTVTNWEKGHQLNECSETASSPGQNFLFIFKLTGHFNRDADITYC